MNSAARHLAATGPWALLVIATLASGWLTHDLTDGRWSTGLVILIAAAKIRLVVVHFMEVTWGARAWRLALEIWVLLATAIVLGGYLLPSS